MGRHHILKGVPAPPEVSLCNEMQQVFNNILLGGPPQDFDFFNMPEKGISVFIMQQWSLNYFKTILEKN